MNRDDLWNLWIKNPNKVEQYMLQTKNKKEERVIRDMIEDFILETGITEIRSGSGGYRILGTGLLHEQQEDLVEIETIFGKKSLSISDIDSLVERSKSTDEYKWLLSMYSDSEIKELYLSSRLDLTDKIALKLEATEDTLSVDQISKTPTLFLTGTLQYLWNRSTENPGKVIAVEKVGSNLNVTVDSSAGKFIGSGGENIRKISMLMGVQNINVISAEEV